MEVLGEVSYGMSRPMRYFEGVSWQFLVVLLFAAAILYVFIVSIYRLTLHPLAKYPGPILGRLTDWSIVLKALTGNRHLESCREHDRYGPIVRVGPNTLSLNTSSALRDIYGSRRANVQKSDWYRTVDAPSGAFSTHSEIDRDKHAFRRRVLDHAFSDSALRSAEDFVLDNVRAWCKHIGAGVPNPRAWTPSLNISDWSIYLGFDIMGELTFGESFHCMESDEHRDVPGLMLRSAKFVYIAGLLPFIKLVRPLMGTPMMDYVVGPLATDSSKYVKYANTQMANRLEAEQNGSKKTRKDFMHYLINAKDPQTGRGFNTTELNSDSSLLISAGADTTAITLSATFFYLLHNPNSLDKATQEVRSTFSTLDLIKSGPVLNSLRYLRSCIDESLRLAPPAPNYLSREVLPGGLVIDGEYFPAGTIVGVSAYPMHHNPEYYPDPWAFKPARWIVDEEAGIDAEQIALARSAFCPFSIGPRGCIGKSVAYMEVTLALAHLLWLYDMRLPEAPEKREPSGEGREDSKHWGRRRVDEYQLVEQFLCARDGPMVQFRRR